MLPAGQVSDAERADRGELHCHLRPIYEEISFMTVEPHQPYPASEAAEVLQGNALATWSKLKWSFFLPLLFVGNVVAGTLAWFVVGLVR
jgi:hypothetical protein